MSYKVKNRDEHLGNGEKPKRILALDGGGCVAFWRSAFCKGSKISSVIVTMAAMIFVFAINLI